MHTPPRRYFHPFHSMLSRYSQAPFFQLNDPNFRMFHSKISCFCIMANFWKSAPNDPKWPWHIQGQKYQHAMLHTPPRPKFSSVSLYDELFLTFGPSFGKVHRMTPNDLNMFKVKNTKMHTTYAPEAQIFVHFALQWAVLSYGPIFGKVHRMTQNDLDMTPTDLDIFKVKNTNKHVTYTSGAQIFICFALRWAVFEL